MNLFYWHKKVTNIQIYTSDCYYIDATTTYLQFILTNVSFYHKGKKLTKQNNNKETKQPISRTT